MLVKTSATPLLAEPHIDIYSATKLLNNYSNARPTAYSVMTLQILSWTVIWAQFKMEDGELLLALS